MKPASIGIIGYGAFGAFLAVLIRRFLPGVEARVHSSRFEPDGSKFFTLEEACSADAVILAGNIADFERQLSSILPLIPATSVIVDVASVKGHTTGLLRTLARGRRYIATHPMFGPESYEKRGGDVAGFRIVVSDHTLDEEEYQKATRFLSDLGFDVIRMDAAEHDRLLAESLFLTHFISQSIVGAGFARTNIDTVSFGYLMHAVDSVKNDTALFRDVYRYVPYCMDVIARLEKGEAEAKRLLSEGAGRKAV